MFKIDEDKTIHLTRGDVAEIVLRAKDNMVFEKGCVVRFKVFEKKDCESVVLQKDFEVVEESSEMEIYLGKEDTKIGGLINKPKDYWYEIELNPETKPQTVLGYEEDGAKIFKLYPEGGEKK